MRAPRVHIRPLTTLRFVAALWVVIFHTAPAHLRAVGGKMIELGFTSVSFFFILSGFVLGVAYLHRMDKVTNASFFLSRVARIYPLYFLTLCLDTPVLLLARITKYGYTFGVAKTVVTFIASVCMLKAWWPQRLMGIDDPNWSLSVEALFYLAFPFVVRRFWPASFRKDSAWIVALYSFAMLLVWSATSLHTNIKVVFYNPLLHLGAFFEGILLSRLYLLWMQKDRARIALRQAAILLALSSVVLLLLEVHFIPFPLLHDGGLLPAFSLLILAFSSANALIEKLFSNAFFVLLGESSYGLYLWHVVIWHWFFGELYTQPKTLWSYPLFLVGTISLSVVSYLYLEKPARQLVLTAFQARTVESPLVASLAE